MNFISRHHLPKSLSPHAFMMEDSPTDVLETAEMRFYRTSASHYDRERAMIEDRIKQIKKQQHIVLPKEHVENFYFREELESLDTQVDANSKNIWRNVEGYAKCSCRMLCQQIQNALPPELRQMIYSYLHDAATVAVNDWPSFPDKRSLAVPIPYFTHYPGSQHDGLGSAHYWNTEYVGKEVVQELAKLFYANTYFDFTNNFHLIPRVLKEDRWNLGLVPGSRICHVRMDLFDHWWVPKLPPKDTKSADNLLLFKPSTRFVFDIQDTYNSFFEDEEDISSYIRHFEVLFPFVRRLEKAGYRLTFRVLEPYLDEDCDSIELIWDSVEGLADDHFKVSLRRLRTLINQFTNGLDLERKTYMLPNLRQRLNAGSEIDPNRIDDGMSSAGELN